MTCIVYIALFTVYASGSVSDQNVAINVKA